jgi:Ribbon-helix-helix protein, copG family
VVPVKRLQIMLEEDLDDGLGRLAKAERVSKAALIRRFVRAALDSLPPLADDTLATMVGVDSFRPDSVDSVVYR